MYVCLTRENVFNYLTYKLRRNFYIERNISALSKCEELENAHLFLAIVYASNVSTNPDKS